MRIVAGSAKGTKLAPVPDGVRPMSDRAREGLFASLGARVLGARVLDLFAGTGATGIEALSRGGDHAVFVERSRPALKAIRENLERAKVVQSATVVAADAHAYLGGPPRASGPFDLVLCDPPYELGPPQLDEVLRELHRGWLAGTAWTVVLTRGRQSSMPVIPLHWSVARELRYGDSLLTLFRPDDQEA